MNSPPKLCLLGRRKPRAAVCLAFRAARSGPAPPEQSAPLVYLQTNSHATIDLELALQYDYLISLCFCISLCNQLTCRKCDVNLCDFYILKISTLHTTAFFFPFRSHIIYPLKSHSLLNHSLFYYQLFRKYYLQIK